MAEPATSGTAAAPLGEGGVSATLFDFFGSVGLLGGLGWYGWSRPVPQPSDGLVYGLGLVAFLALLTARRNLATRGPEISSYLQGTDRGARLQALVLELLVLAALQGSVYLAWIGQLVLVLCCFAAFVLDNVLMALGLFGISLWALVNLAEIAEYLARKLRRFYHYDGVVLTREAGIAKTTWREHGFRAWADAVLDAALLPPVTFAGDESIRLIQATVQVDPTLPCKVCGEGLGEALLVACDRCHTPHHRECFEYSERCAVYGCGATGSHEVQSQIPTASAQPELPRPEAESALLATTDTETRGGLEGSEPEDPS